MLRRLNLIVVMMFFVSLVYAEPIIDKDNKSWTVLEKNKDYKTYTKEKFTTKLNASGYYEKIAKPKISEDKLLTAEESKDVRLALWNSGLVDETNKVIKEGRKLIFEQAIPAKNDYKHDYDRGTIHFTTQLRKDGTPYLRNYSYSKVIIPDGTVIKECNFTQRKADTDAIQGENLTFIDCNLVNVRRHASWTLQGCNNCQISREIKSQKVLEDGSTELTIAHKVKDKDGVFKEVAEDIEVIRADELENRMLYYQ